MGIEKTEGEEGRKKEGGCGKQATSGCRVFSVSLYLTALTGRLTEVQVMATLDAAEGELIID